jgi:hypothetical protein
MAAKKKLTRKKVSYIIREVGNYLKEESADKELNEVLLARIERLMLDAISGELMKEINENSGDGTSSKSKLNIREKSTYIHRKKKGKGDRDGGGPVVLTKKDAQKMDDFKKGQL